MVTDFAALNEFGGDGSDHQVAAVRTARRIGESAGGGELRPTFMKQHVTASLSSRSVPMSTGASWQGRDALVKVWWPKRQTFATHTNATVPDVCASNLYYSGVVMMSALCALQRTNFRHLNITLHSRRVYRPRTRHQ